MRYSTIEILMILGTFNAVLVVKMTPEDGEIDLRVIYMGEFSSMGGVEL